MNPRALRAAALLFGIFLSVALLVTFVADVRAEDVRSWLVASRERPVFLFFAVIALLAVDSVFAVPTITTIVAAGYLLGPWLGALSSLLGVLAAGSLCYWGGRFFGVTRWLESKGAAEIRATVGEVGPTPLLVARLVPMLPEVLSAMAGAGRMPASKYYLYFTLGNLPFATLLAYAGSESTFERPWPALAAGVGLPALLAGFVLWWRRRAEERGP